MKIKIFKASVAAIAAICCIAGTASVGVTAAEIDESELVSYNLDNSEDNTTPSESELPESYSSKDLGFVTSVKKQPYNDCWAFAGLAALESKLLKSGYNIESMSESHLNAWATTRSNNKGWIRNYTGDGYGTTALGYFTSWQGGVFESDAGQIDVTKVEHGDDVATDLAKYGVTGIEYLSKDNPEEIKRAIMEDGGVYSAYAHAPACLSDDRTAYYMPSAYISGYTGHAIEVVGWDDNYSVDNFKTPLNIKPKNPGAWLIKNSWGNNNSLGGYFWMSYEDKFIFATKYRPSYSIKSVQPINDNTKLYQNEIDGATYEFSYINSDSVTYLNKFDFSDGYNTLDKVIFKSESLNSDYSIYYVPTDNDTPTANTDDWTKLYSGSVDYKGYICADIDDYTLPEGSGSIAVTIDSSNADNNANASIGVCEWLKNTSSKNYVFINDSKYGDSYIYYNNTMTDSMDWYKTNNDDELGGTFVIKAVTTKPETPLIGDVDLNGVVDIRDTTAIQKYIANIVQLDEKAMLNADFNADGRVDITDATAIQQYLAKNND